MAKKIRAQVVGGEEKSFDNVETVQDVMSQMNLRGKFVITINGDVADEDTELNDYEFVTFTQAKTGGLSLDSSESKTGGQA